MAVREAGSRWRGGAEGADGLRQELRGRWRTASFAAGWRFPSDWGVPEVDQVCASVVDGADLPAALGGLGRARARAGAGLDETLADLAALHAVLESGSPDPDAVPSRLVRATALAWADASLGELSTVAATENLTGLATTEYLRVRLGEVYRAGRRGGFTPADRYVLLVVSVDLSRTAGWPRLLAMALVGDILREVFDGGESVAVLGPSTAVVLTERARGLTDRASRARTLITTRFTTDTDLHPARRPDLTLERLPTTEPAAHALLDRLARA